MRTPANRLCVKEQADVLAVTNEAHFAHLSPHQIVGWEVYPEESAEHAASVFHKAHLREGVRADTLVLHSNKGAPMQGATMLATLQCPGVSCPPSIGPQ